MASFIFALGCIIGFWLVFMLAIPHACIALYVRFGPLGNDLKQWRKDNPEAFKKR